VQDKDADIRLVAIDLDGTLLTDDKEVCARSAEALMKLPARGVQVVIASARPPRSVRKIYRQLGLDTLQINYNGALIWDEPSGKALFHRPMSGAIAREIVDAARAIFEEVLVTCEVMDRWLTDRPDNTYTTETGRLFRPDFVGPLDGFCAPKLHVTKLMLLGERCMIERLENALVPRFSHQVTILRTDNELIQLMDRRVSKSVALSKVARHYGVPQAQVMAIGDAPNDVGMLQWASVGVAVANGYEVVKGVADWIAPSNNDHGVLEALRRYGLCD